jgi:hypothetical protein
VYVTVLSVEKVVRTVGELDLDQAGEAALAEEEQRIRQLRLLVALTTAVLKTRPLSQREAAQVVDQLRRQVALPANSISNQPATVMPAQAGIQTVCLSRCFWIPAFAGMTNPKPHRNWRAKTRQVLTLFPEKGSVFDLIYEPRFRRIIRERLGREEAGC